MTQTIIRKLEMEIEKFPGCPDGIAGCVACGGKLTRINHHVQRCDTCGGLDGRMSRGDASCYVKIGTMVNQGEAETRYFDFTLLNERGLGMERVHGWYRTDTKEVVQYG